MKSMYFINDSVGYIVSDEGYVFTTSDSGNSWSALKLAAHSLNDIRFINQTGFIVGYSGKIFKTADGRNWTEKNSGTANKLRAVYFIDADTGYAFGDFATLIKTTDSGENWVEIDHGFGSNMTLTDGAFPTADFGFCVSYEGDLLRTLDYGKTWESIPLYYSPGVHYYSVCFIDDSTGFVTGWEYDLGFMLKIVEYGNEIDIIYPGVIGNIRSSHFVDSSSGYIVGDGGYISKTTKGGQSWNWNTLFSPSNKNLYTVYFTDSLHGYAAGDDSTILKTTDGGENWSLTGSGPTAHWQDVYFHEKNLGYAVGAYGLIYEIKNDTLSLIFRDSSDYNNFHFIHFIDDSTGFSGGYMLGKLFKTNDGAQSWTVDDFHSQGVLGMSSIDFHENQTGIIAANDKLLKSSDGGENWKVIDANTSSADVVFIDGETLISVGWDGVIFKSTDSGETWLPMNSATNQSLRGVDFIDEQVGFAVGYYGTAVKTTDGGENWRLLNLGTKKSLWKIKFLNENTGYIIGDDGIILYTTDGGENWGRQYTGTDYSLNGIYFVDNQTGYIVGANGTFLKTVNGGVTGMKSYVKPTSKFLLFPNYPNPFNPITTIRYEIPESGTVTLNIYDIRGRLVKTILNADQRPGDHFAVWDGTDNTGNAVASGLYIYQLRFNNISQSRRLILLR